MGPALPARFPWFCWGQVCGKFFEVEITALVQGKDPREILHFGIGFTLVPPGKVDHQHGPAPA